MGMADSAQDPRSEHPGRLAFNMARARNLFNLGALPRATVGALQCIPDEDGKIKRMRLDYSSESLFLSKTALSIPSIISLKLQPPASSSLE